jgi:hypothetical protein
MIWNPLDYIEDFTPLQNLDLNDVRHLGEKVTAVAILQGVHNELSPSTSKVVGREVGDDRVDLSRDVFPLVTTLVAQEDLLFMVTSWQDTSIRRGSWNFCEVTGGPLTDPSQGFDHIRRNGDFKELGFNDSVVLRIILDVQKGEGEDHSSTQPGKMSMLGSRLATPRQENRGMWMIASIFQDAMLCTHRASEPKYLPPVMGGTGVTALFDNSNNVYLYVLAYKGGTYARIYGTACAEMKEYLYRLERGVQSAPILCPRLREKQEYFWGTYDNMVFVPKERGVINTDAPPPPLYERTGGENRFQNFETRLVRTRHLVTRRQAQVEWSHTRRLQSIFQGVFDTMAKFSDLDNEESKRLKARYDGALNANSALQNLLKREAGRADAMILMGSDAFHTVTTGRREFTRLDAEWVYLNGQGEFFSLKDVSLSEDMFVREEVSAEETFKVEGIPLRPQGFGVPVTRYTKTRVGLYLISSTMEEWSEDLLQRLKAARDRLGRPLRPIEIEPIFMENPEWVNDDTGLIALCHSDVSTGRTGLHGVALISGDRKLANKMANTCNVKVTRISPREFVRLSVNAGYLPSHNSPTDFLLKKLGRNLSIIYKDTGSIASAASLMVEGDDGEYYRRTVRATGWQGTSRFSSVTLVPVRREKLEVETHFPIVRPRIWRAGSKPWESVYSSHSSWKGSRKSASETSDWWRRPDTNSYPTRTEYSVGE